MRVREAAGKEGKVGSASDGDDVFGALSGADRFPRVVSSFAGGRFFRLVGLAESGARGGV
jgi:hypothetical protein